MNPKKTIAIDIDDVIADSTESLRRLVNERWAVNLTKEDYRIPGAYRKYYEKVWEQHGIADKINFADLEAEMVLDQSHVPIMEGADVAVRELMQKHKVIFITARHASWDKATRVWLKQLLEHDNVDIHFSEGIRNTNAQTKGQLCKRFGAEWLIDDNPSHCRTALEEGVNTILFGDYGWHINEPDGVVRCKTWREVMGYFADAI